MQEQQGRADIDVLDDDSLVDLPPLIACSQDDDDSSIDSNDKDATATLSLGDTEYDSDVDNQSISNEQIDQEASFTQGELEDKPDKDSLFSDDLEQDSLFSINECPVDRMKCIDEALKESKGNFGGRLAPHLTEFNE